MSTQNNQLSNTILGGFFGALYSIILVGPLVIGFNSTYQPAGKLLVDLLNVPLILLFAYMIVIQSIKWMEINYNERIIDKSPKMIPAEFSSILTFTLYSLLDKFKQDKLKFPGMIITLLLMSAYVLWRFSALNGKSIFLWITGVYWIVLLQLKSTSLLID